MRTEQMLVGERPARDVSTNPTLHVFQPGDRVVTGNGEMPVERLRPGDRVAFEHVQAGARVQWMEMRRCKHSGKMRIHVMLGNGGGRRKTAPDLPVAGRISRKTGLLEIETRYASARGAGPRVH